MSEANTMTQDKELLELAAKAAGYNAKWFGDVFCIEQEGDIYRWYGWYPLQDDGAALRLAVKLGILSHPLLQHYFAVETLMPEKDPYAATRRAIVRAAAELSKANAEIGKTL